MEGGLAARLGIRGPTKRGEVPDEARGPALSQSCLRLHFATLAVHYLSEQPSTTSSTYLHVTE